jgi:hypothetical protein
VDYNPAFKLYLVTRNATPALTPDVAPLLTVTNFSITRSGLESKCLVVSCKHVHTLPTLTVTLHSQHQLDQLVTWCSIFCTQ